MNSFISAKGRLGLVFALLLSCTSLWAQTEAEIVAAHRKARGGEAAWQKVTSLQLEGEFTGFSLTHPFVLQKSRPNKVHMTWTLGDKPMEMGFDGHQAWWLNPWYGFDWITPMSAVDRTWQHMYHYLATPFFDTAAHGLTMAFKGRGELDGQAAWVFEFKNDTGHVETWYLDPNTYLEFARVATGSEFGRPAVQNTWFEDFRKVGELVLPHHIESEFTTRHRVIHINKVTVNPDLAAEVFSRPQAPALQPLNQLSGTWQVAVKTRQSPRQPWQEEQTRAVITPMLDGQMLQETIAYGKATPANFLRQYSFDRSRDRLLIVQTDSFTNNTAILVGAKTDAGWQWHNSETNSGWKFGESTMLDRITLKELSDTSFKLDLESSRDEGKTWELHTQLEYHKAD